MKTNIQLFSEKLNDIRLVGNLKDKDITRLIVTNLLEQYDINISDKEKEIFIDKYCKKFNIPDELLIPDEIMNEAWDNLKCLGYSEGDIIMSDDYVRAFSNSREYIEENDLDISDLMDIFESKFNVYIYAPQVLIGDKPGKYKHIDFV